ncbi:MAG: hypothetical protein U0Y08_11455 [Bacteroidia bacterium]
MKNILIGVLLLLSVSCRPKMSDQWQDGFYSIWQENNCFHVKLWEGEVHIHNIHQYRYIKLQLIDCDLMNLSDSSILPRVTEYANLVYVNMIEKDRYKYIEVILTKDVDNFPGNSFWFAIKKEGIEYYGKALP